MKCLMHRDLARVVLATCTAAMMLSLPAVAQADVRTYKETLRSTVWVLAKGADGNTSGTGVLVDAERKLIITNFHVVGDARKTVIFFPDMEDGKPNVDRQHYVKNVKRLGIRGQVVGVDRKRDLALIELNKLPANAQAIQLAPDSVGQAEAVESIGNPGSSGALWVYTSGTVRAVYQKKFRTGAGEHHFKVVETDAPINSGDSGGPVVNENGELVAISQAISSKARLLTYCVDITEVKQFLSGPWKPAPLPIVDMLTKAELEHEKHESGHLEVKFEQKDEDEQSVFVTNEIEYFERADVRKIWSLAMVSKEAPNLETAMKLLQQSARTKMGAWSVEKTNQEDYMIIYVVKIDATATPAALKSTMGYVAKLARIMKKELRPKEESEDQGSDTLDLWLAD